MEAVIGRSYRSRRGAGCQQPVLGSASLKEIARMGLQFPLVHELIHGFV